jgi:DNA-damage-inducible protein J
MSARTKAEPVQKQAKAKVKPVRTKIISNTKNKDEVVRARINSDIKNDVELILSECGLNTTTAITLFFQQIRLHKGLPFPVSLPNETTLQALRDMENNHNITISSFDDFAASLDD